MGVTGLWSIVDSVGHPINLETLHNKVIAIDLSLWVNQSIKGFRGRNGQTIENAHVLGLFHRICKLLFYRIKPVFVFDGSCPQLKMKTINKRAEQRNKAIDKSRETSMKVLKNFIASQLSSTSGQELPIDDSLPSLQSSLLLMPENRGLKIYEELNELERTQNFVDISDESDPEIEPKIAHNYRNVQNLDSIDMESEEFNGLPPDIRYEILTELKLKFKGYRNQELMPNESNNFSSFQLKRLLKKRELQSKIEETIRQLNGQHSEEVIENWKQNGMYSESESKVGRLVSDESTHFIFLKKSQTSSSETSTQRMNSENKSFETTEDMATSRMSSAINKSIESSCHTISDASDSEDIQSNSQISCETFSKRIENSETVEVLNEKKVSKEVLLISDESEDEMKTTNDNIIDKSNEIIDSMKDPKESTNFTKIKVIEVSSDSDDNDFEEVWPQTPDSLDKFMDQLSDTELQNFVSNQKNKEVIKSDDKAINRFDNIDDNKETFSDPKPSLQSNSDPKASGSQSKPFETIRREDIVEMNKQNRISNKVSDQMMSECQELLTLFGIPFVMSPMEAEAQCAALESLGLTDGTITDDSDVLLFGAQTIYKNFFTSSKYVELFKSSDIESRFGLSRTSMICIALLCGSDYTDGVDGVGAVTATEILSEFPGDGLKPLIDFKQWLDSKQKGSDKRPENAIRAKLLKFRLNDSFPNQVIFDAYMNPTVDHSKEKFFWSMPRLDELRSYAINRFGWTSTKTDEILVPLMKKVNEKQTQMTIDNYFKIQVQPKNTSILSKRLNKAIDKLKGKESAPETSAQNKSLSALSQKVKNQRKRRQTKTDKQNVKSKQSKQLSQQMPQQIILSESSDSDD